MNFKKLFLFFCIVAVINSCKVDYKVYENGHLNHKDSYTFSYKNSTNDSCLVFGQNDTLPDSSQFIKEVKIKYGYEENTLASMFSQDYSLLEVAKEEAKQARANIIKIKTIIHPIMFNTNSLIVDLYKLNKPSFDNSLTTNHESLIHIKILKGYYPNTVTHVYYNNSLIDSSKFLSGGIPDKPVINFKVDQSGIISFLNKNEINSGISYIQNNYTKIKYRNIFPISKEHFYRNLENLISYDSTNFMSRYQFNVTVGKEYYVHFRTFTSAKNGKSQGLIIVSKYDF